VQGVRYIGREYDFYVLYVRISHLCVMKELVYPGQRLCFASEYSGMACISNISIIRNVCQERTSVFVSIRSCSDKRQEHQCQEQGGDESESRDWECGYWTDYADKSTICKC
jgi:hypothetical protein